MPDPRNYADITDILARKAKGRTALAALSFGEKLKILDQLKATSDSFAMSRETNRLKRDSSEQQ